MTQTGATFEKKIAKCEIEVRGAQNMPVLFEWSLKHKCYNFTISNGNTVNFVQLTTLCTPLQML